MIQARFDWNGDTAYRMVLDAAWEGIQRATVFFWRKVQEALNASGKVGRGTRAKDYQASRPGEPPRKRTGWLQRHVLYELERDELTSRVGLGRNAIYGLYLELGTRFMAARPWLLATLNRYWAQIQAQIDTKV